MATLMQFIDDQKAKARELEPTLEGLLQEAEVDESVIMAFHVQKILDRELFVSLNANDQEFAERHGFLHKLEYSHSHKA